MRFTSLLVENWRNFLQARLELRQRVFLVGPNAAGKSNLLDVFRFLRDIAEPQGGLQVAVERRRGVSRLRSLHARQSPDVVLELGVRDDAASTDWKYRLVFNQDSRKRPVVRAEEVWRDGEALLNRPDGEDRQDQERLTQTHLEQVSANREFRPLAEFLSEVRYLHVVPQLIRTPERYRGVEQDPFGSDLLEQIAKTDRRTRASRLRRIESALKVAVPQLRDLKLEQDKAGVPHLVGTYEHWRAKGARQSEEELSDGTLRLVGLLWSFLDGRAPLLLEEPELSLHVAIVRKLPSMMAKLNRKQGRQILVSTHSFELLMDPGIAPEEVILLVPTREATEARQAAEDQEIVRLMQSGVPAADAVLPRTEPRQLDQLSLFDA